MHYPWWHVPVVTAPMLIALVSVLHVVVSHYAVGGGLFLAVETRYAYRSGDDRYLEYLHRHAWFFVLLTVVYGAITGVGIWWTIGLASPLATETLIHVFVFGWAMEYVFFVVEIVSAFIFYYMWGRLEPRVHQTVGWIYAVSAWMSLVLVTGITAFMLNPGSWVVGESLWKALFNPQMVPQTLARTGGALLLACLYVYLHAAFTVRDVALRDLIARHSARAAMLGAILVMVGGMGWFAVLPASARAALAAASALTVLAAIVFALTAAVFALLYLGPYRNPSWLSPGFAIVLFGCGLAAIATGEYIREAVRKPYVVYNAVMSNQIYPAEIPVLQTNGYLEGGRWTNAYVSERYPQVMDGRKIDERRLIELPARDRKALGEVLFQYHCADCHAARLGYAPVGPLVRGWTPEMIRAVVREPNRARFFMPPWAGTLEEADLLTEYLLTLAEPLPAGMNYGRSQ